ncbi:hypothetical protein [Streptomyces laurentii]|uniref:hypothetical protein n=1 Tax=Streptomyces laurentii TaxID=39478 RepID=UPI0036B6026E
MRGLACGAALKAVLASWEERVGEVKGECGALAPALRRVADEQHEQDVRVKSSVDAVPSEGPLVPGSGRRFSFWFSDGGVPSGSSTP